MVGGAGATLASSPPHGMCWAFLPACPIYPFDMQSTHMQTRGQCQAPCAPARTQITCRLQGTSTSGTTKPMVTSTLKMLSACRRISVSIKGMMRRFNQANAFTSPAPLESEGCMPDAGQVRVLRAQPAHSQAAVPADAPPAPERGPPRSRQGGHGEGAAPALALKHNWSDAQYVHLQQPCACVIGSALWACQ